MLIVIIYKFRHIIYIQKNELNVKTYPFLYFYFQKVFFNFVKEFILNLSKARGCLTVKEAFRRADNNFNESIKKIVEFNNSETCKESNINIICMEGAEE